MSERKPVANQKPPNPRVWDRAELLVPRPVGEEPELISDGGGLAFPPAALDGQAAGLLDLTDPAAVALLAQIRGERQKVRLPWSRSAPAPDPEVATPEALAVLRGWRQLARTDNEVLFGRGRPPDLLTVAIRREPRRDKWVPVGVSRGKQLRAARENVRASSWRVDPNFEPTPHDSELRILVTEQRRASGNRADGRFLEPELHIGEAELILTIFISPLPVMGVQGGNPETPVRIALPEPVGERELVDGAVYEPP